MVCWVTSPRAKAQTPELKLIKSRGPFTARRGNGSGPTTRRETGVEVHSSPWVRRCQRSSIRRVKDPLTDLPGCARPLLP